MMDPNEKTFSPEETALMDALLEYYEGDRGLGEDDIRDAIIALVGVEGMSDVHAEGLMDALREMENIDSEAVGSSQVHEGMDTDHEQEVENANAILAILGVSFRMEDTDVPGFSHEIYEEKLEEGDRDDDDDDEEEDDDGEDESSDDKGDY